MCSIAGKQHPPRPILDFLPAGVGKATAEALGASLPVERRTLSRSSSTVIGASRSKLDRVQFRGIDTKVSVLQWGKRGLPPRAIGEAVHTALTVAAT